jgi:hypothetical protein
MNQPVQELSQAAQTLADLKNLPADQKDRLFLAKLAKMSRHDSNVLNKRNLALPNDPYGFRKSGDRLDVYPLSRVRTDNVPSPRLLAGKNRHVGSIISPRDRYKLHLI